MSSHRNRRGWIARALLGCLLALVVLGAAGAVALGVTHRAYESRGVIRIAAVKRMRSQGAPFRAFMDAQVAILGSMRVADAAVQDPAWRSMGVTPPSGEELARRIRIERTPGGELIEIACRDHNPAFAAAAVNATINAYSDLFNSDAHGVDRQRTGVLMDRRDQIVNQISTLESQRSKLIGELGTADFGPLLRAASERLSAIEARLTADDIAAADPPAPVTRPAEPPARAPALVRLRDEAKQHVLDLARKQDELVNINRQLKELLDQRSAIERRIESVRAENQLGSPLTIISTGNVAAIPESPWRDPAVRRMLWIGAGAIVLLLLVLALSKSKAADGRV